VLIDAYCQECHRQILGQDGVVHACQKDIWERHRIRREVEREQAALKHELGLIKVVDGVETEGGDIGDFITVDELAKRIPNLVKWEVHCDDCNPHEAVSNGEVIAGRYCDDCYWFSVDRISDWSSLIDWQKHLSEKDWFEDTDWFGLLADLDKEDRSGLRFTGPIFTV
jgi:hypothetical protein